MRDRLPSIHIAVADPRSFAEKMAEMIAGKSDSFTVQHYPDSPASGDLTVALRFTKPSRHRDLGAHLVCNADGKRDVAVEVRAGEWLPESFPSYGTYCATAEIMFKPLLAVYNAEQKTKYRIAITPKERLEPNLPPLSGKLFRHFIANANITALHYRDWRRFYEFVRISPPRLSECDVAFLLTKEGFSEQSAREIAMIYTHLRDFKRPREAAEIYEQHHIRKQSKAG